MGCSVLHDNEMKEYQIYKDQKKILTISDAEISNEVSPFVRQILITNYINEDVKQAEKDLSETSKFVAYFTLYDIHKKDNTIFENISLDEYHSIIDQMGPLCSYQLKEEIVQELNQIVERIYNQAEVVNEEEQKLTVEELVKNAPAPDNTEEEKSGYKIEIDEENNITVKLSDLEINKIPSYVAQLKYDIPLELYNNILRDETEYKDNLQKFAELKAEQIGYIAEYRINKMVETESWFSKEKNEEYKLSANDRKEIIDAAVPVIKEYINDVLQEWKNPTKEKEQIKDLNSNVFISSEVAEINGIWLNLGKYDTFRISDCPHDVIDSYIDDDGFYGSKSDSYIRSKSQEITSRIAKQYNENLISVPHLTDEKKASLSLNEDDIHQIQTECKEILRNRVDIYCRDCFENFFENDFILAYKYEPVSDGELSIGHYGEIICGDEMIAEIQSKSEEVISLYREIGDNDIEEFSRSAAESFVEELTEQFNKKVENWECCNNKKERFYITEEKADRLAEEIEVYFQKDIEDFIDRYQDKSVEY